MSGITPLIDTLLHQVLGKRVDVPVPRELNAPVQPSSPGDAVQALRSDSRLDPRQGAVTSPLVGRSLDQGLPPSDLSRPGAQPSTQTHLSPSAQTIASVLERFPAPASTLRVQGPLLPAEASTAPATQVASRLQQSIETSGLFYESHLSKWYRGELPRQQLALEPQMHRANSANLFQQLTPVTTAPSPMSVPLPVPATMSGSAWTSMFFGSVPVGGPDVTAQGAGGQSAFSATSGPVNQAAGSSAGASLVPNSSSMPQSSGVSPHSSGSPALQAYQQVGGAERAEMPMPHASADRSHHAPASTLELDDAQQNVVRHQLEMLATPSPVLRWEGDVWSGVFMALVVQMPQGERRDGEQSASDERDEDADQGAWQTQMSLQVNGLGKLDVKLRFAPKQLDISLVAENQAVLARLHSGEADLRTRLQACGYEAVGLQMIERQDERGSV